MVCAGRSNRGLTVEARRYPVVFRNDGLHGPMLGCFHWQVQGLRASQFRNPLKWIDKPRADDESRRPLIDQIGDTGRRALMNAANAASSSFGRPVVPCVLTSDASTAKVSPLLAPPASNEFFLVRSRDTNSEP